MSKRMKRLLSLILTLVMVVSLFPSTAFALGGGSGVGIGGDEWGRDIGEDEIQDFTDYDPEVQDVEEYDYFQALDLDTFAEVLVQAPLGALPTLAEVRLEAIPVEDMREAVDAVVEGKPEILVALDISFWLGNEEIEPAEPVRVKISAPVLEGKSGLQVIHFPDNNARPETMQLIGQEELSFPLGSNEIAFVAESFSTYAVTWSGDGSATIHWGYMSEGSFTPFSDVATLDDTAGSMNLNLIFEGYIYSSATYVNGEVEYALDSPILTKVTAEGGSTSWTMQAHVTTGEAGAPETVTIENGTDIYVYYVEKTSGYTPPSPAPADVKGPVTDKNVTPNGDGTYKIHLDVTGQVDHTVNRTGANVIVIMDRTTSMNESMGSSTRMAAARTALQTLITTLNPGTGEDQNLINLCVMEFYNNPNARYGLQWTQSRSDMDDYASGLDVITGTTRINRQYYTNGNGTCWQAGFYGGILRASEVPNNDTLKNNKTYVIFVTDGNPNAYYTANTNGSWSNGNTYTQTGNGYFVEAAYNASLPNAVNLSTLVGNRLYGVYCGGANDDGKGHLQALMTATSNGSSVNGTFIDGTSADAINNAFRNIAQTIVNDIGASNVGVDDGIPKLANVSAAVSGSAGGFAYYITYPLTLVASGEHEGQYTYTHNGEKIYVAANTVTGSAVDRDADNYKFKTGYSYATENGVRTYYYTMVWEGAPSAGYSSSNGVTWNLEDQGVLADKTIYSLEFDVWPSQEAYDLLANLNNNMEGWTLDVLDDETLEQMVVTLNNSDYTYKPGATAGTGTWSNGTYTYASTDAFLDAIDAAGEDNVYYNIMTNTHLFTTYEYNGASFSDPPENGLVSGAMLLEDQTISIVKYWHNDLDARSAQNISLTITRDGVNYMDVEMGKPEKIGDHEWVQAPEVELFISCGIMTVDESTNVLTMNTTGHDYSVVENDGSPWYWDLTAYTYHPMVVNAENTMLILVTDEQKTATGFPSAALNLENNKRVQTGGKWYYKFDDKLYVQTDDATNVLRADNDRRSNMEITKAITGNDAPEDELFTFEINMENATTPYLSDDAYNADYHTFWFVVLKNADIDPENPDWDDIALVEDGLSVTGAYAEILKLRTDDSNITNIVTHAADDTYPYPYITYNYKGSPYTVKAVNLQLQTGTEGEGENQVTYQYYSYYTGYYWFDNVEGGNKVTAKIKAGWRICFTSITKNTEYTVEEIQDEMPDGFVLDSVSTSAVCQKAGEEAHPGVVSTENPALVEGLIDNSNSGYKVGYTNTFAGYFYVYHSSDNSVERIGMAKKGVAYHAAASAEDTAVTFDIYALTAAGTLYGGYYSDYAGKSEGFDADAAKALNYSGKENPKDTDGTAYSYQAIAGDDENAAITWDWSLAASVAGTAMIPTINTVYYLKEVPNGYQLPYTHFTYYKDDTFTLGTVWAITAVDDLNYSAAGFYVETANKPGVYLKSITIKTDRGSSEVELTAGKVFRSKGMLAGYLGYVEITDYMAKNATVVIRQYWTTKDGINVFGVKMRSLSFGNCTYSGIGKTDSDYVPITTDP